MLPIPLYVFLVIYILFALGTAIYFVFNIYHIFAADEFSLPSLLITVAVGGTMTFVILTTWSMLSAVDWNENFSFFDNSWVQQQD